MAQTPSDDNNTLPRLSDVKSVLGKNREYIRRCIGADGVMDEFLRKMNGNLESSVDNFDSAMNAFLQKLDDGSSNLQQEVDQFLSILKDLHQHCHQTLYAMLRRGIPCSDDDKKSYKNNIEMNSVPTLQGYPRKMSDPSHQLQFAQPLQDTNLSGQGSIFACTASDADKRVADEMKYSKKQLDSKRREVGLKGVEYISGLEQRLGEVELDLQTKCTEIMKEQHASREHRLELQHKGEEIDKLKEENTKQKKKIDKLKKENSELKEKNSELKEENSELKGKNSELKRKNSELKEENSELKEENSELKGKNSELKEENSELKGKNSKLEELANQKNFLFLPSNNKN